MADLLIIYKDIVLGFLQSSVRVVSVFSVSLAIVYLFGRMLEIIHTYRLKNMLACIVIFMANAGYSKYLHGDIAEGVDFWILWEIVVYSSFSILLYVLVGFKLYERCDDFLDKKLGKDKPVKHKRKK